MNEHYRRVTIERNGKKFDAFKCNYCVNCVTHEQVAYEHWRVKHGPRQRATSHQILDQDGRPFVSD